MKTAFFDTFSGISGDMIIGAFLNLGMPFEILQNELKKLNFSGYELEYEEIKRSSISATHFNVRLIDGRDHHHRDLNEIKKIINASTLKDEIKNRAIKIFQFIGEAEAKVHNVPIDKIHFHEVGAIDSIIDIVGISICIEEMNIKNIYTNYIPFGQGYVETQHGKMPIPAPASIELLKNYPIKILDIPFELTTPTGAAFVASESKGLYELEKFKVEKIGYGAGTKEIPQIPNLLRLMIGEKIEDLEFDECVMIETNIDDMNPQFYPYILEKLFEINIFDAYLVPVIMKKGRPGIIISVLCFANKKDEVINLLYKETTTLGVRVKSIERLKLPRVESYADTNFGKIRVKIVDFNGEKKVIPEYEECKKISQEKNIPLKEVYEKLIIY